ncbi:hypothetical protein E2C01_088674 [Portunus trituberculatus]|uniref:Uncharacterized protein n=1 Tax=Portunus trituberculatus TaxID=210409 RepID=A0A5B7J6T2_PORTR|nr:hypothetical protein [Portunus trituberculatus]
MSLTKSAELLGSILLLPNQFCCLLGERWQILRLSPTSSRSTLPVFPGRILQPQAHVTARERNFLAKNFLPLEGSPIMSPSLSPSCGLLCPSVITLLLVQTTFLMPFCVTCLTVILTLY